MQDRLPYRRAMGISGLEGDADGGGGPSTGEGLSGTGSEAEPLSDEYKRI